MYAKIESTLLLSPSGPSERRLCSALRAISGFFRLTAFHGDSGAKYAPMKRGSGQIHCKAKGNRHPNGDISSVSEYTGVLGLTKIALKLGNCSHYT